MGCCLCTEPQQQTYRPILNISTSTRLQYLDSDKCNCLYGCGGDQYIYYLHLSHPISIKICDSLFERGFVRNSLYFRKYDLQSCCIGYNIRINVLNNNFNSKQQKIVTKLINKYFPQIGEIQIKNVRKGEIVQQENQIINNTINYQNPVECIDKIKYEKDKVEIEKCVKVILQMLEEDVLEIAKQLSSQNFNSKFLKQENLKIFYNKQFQTYFSNLNLLLYEQNKQLQDLNQEKINIILGQLYNNKIIQNKYKIFQGSSGYLTIIDLENYDAKQIQFLEKNKNKKHKSEKQKKNMLNEIKDPQSQFRVEINDLTHFSLGDVQISIQDPLFQDEAYKLYQQYMFEVHNSEVNEKEFSRYYATNITSQDSYKTNQTGSQQLYQGQRFMMYRLKGKLIGCGVILILSNILISEYLFYDPILKPQSFGIFATFAELEYVKAINKIFPDFKYHSLCYVISKNQSMNYKLQFSGLEIQCPTTYKWLKYDQKIKSLMLENCSKLCQENQEIRQKINLNDYKVKINEQIISVSQLNFNSRNEVINILNQNINILGEDLMKQIIFNIE